MINITTIKISCASIFLQKSNELSVQPNAKANIIQDRVYIYISVKTSPQMNQFDNVKISILTVKLKFLYIRHVYWAQLLSYKNIQKLNNF